MIRPDFRFGRSIRILMLMALGLDPTSSLAETGAKVTSLQPSSPWNLNYANDSCKIRRTFGAGKQLVYLEMARFSIGPNFQLGLAGSTLKPLLQGGKYSVRFGNLATQTELSPISATNRDGQFVSLVNFGSLKATGLKAVVAEFADNQAPASAVSADEEAAVTSITISNNKQVLILQTGSLGPVFAAWRKCVNEIVRSWGVDPDNIKTRAFPIGSPAGWVTSADYPLEALKESMGGNVDFRLSIDASGKVTQCAVLRAINETSFAKITCNLLTRRAHFTAALDMTGKAVPDYFISAVRFVIPDQ